MPVAEATTGCQQVRNFVIDVRGGCLSTGEELGDASIQPLSLGSIAMPPVPPEVLKNHLCLRDVQCSCSNGGCNGNPDTWTCNCPVTSEDGLPPDWAVKSVSISARCCPGSIGSCPVGNGQISCSPDVPGTGGLPGEGPGGVPGF